jgi:hypothetical protein
MATAFQQLIPGLQSRTLSTGYTHLRIHYTADPRKDAAWARKKAMSYGGFDAPKWRREFELDYYAVEGQRVYPMLSSVHVEPKDLTNGDWSFFRGIDYGLRHPTVCLWVAVNARGDRHFYREYYAWEKPIGYNCEEIKRLSVERVQETWIDPATRQRIPISQTNCAPTSIASEFEKGLGCSVRYADNSMAGYDTVKNALLATLSWKANREGVDPDSYLAREYFTGYGVSASEFTGMMNHARITFDPGCPNAFRELQNLRFKTISGDPSQKAAPEMVVDFEDDGPDVVRYLIQSKLKYTSRAWYAEPGSPLDEARKRYEQRKAKENHRRIRRPLRPRHRVG